MWKTTFCTPLEIIFLGKPWVYPRVSISHFLLIPKKRLFRCAALWALAVLATAEEGEDVKGPMITNKAPG
jgi:hypothetical protein